MEKNIIIVGLGNMGDSLVKGLMKNQENSTRAIHLFDIHPEKLNSYKDLTEVKLLTSLAQSDLENAYVLLCVKPHDLPEVVSSLKLIKTKNPVFVSILAGISLTNLAVTLDYKGPIIRAMPNIAATVGCAATVLCQNDSCSEIHVGDVLQIFRSVGEAYQAKESLMDTVTGLSGSGPAYIYMVIEALTDGGVKMGLPRDLAAALATQTVLGAATLVKKSGVHPAILKDRVSTPGGTTISALHSLEASGLRSMFVDAVCIATERSAYLGKTQ